MLKIETDDNLARALLALAAAKRDTAEAMRERAAQEIADQWRPRLTEAAGTEQQRKLLVSGASAEVTPAGFVLTAASGEMLSGGLDTDQWYAIEYGMTPVQIIAPARRKTIRIAGSGRRMRVAARVWVGRNLPPRRRQGHVVYPTVRTHVPRFVEAWIRGLIGEFDAVDGTALDIKKG